MPRRDAPVNRVTPKPNLPALPTSNLPALRTPSFLQTIKEGVGYGIGSSIGHRIVGSILGTNAASTGSAASTVSTASAASTVSTASREYEQCMKDYNTEACEVYLKHEQ
jgi:hypothetical protein